MTSQSPTTFHAADALGLLSKYRVLIVLTTLCTFALGVTAALMLPKKFKADFVLAVDTKYFQSPLTHDFIPEVSDPVQLKSEAASLLRQALTPEFLDAIGAKYGIYQSAEGPPKTPSALDNALKQLKTFAQSHGLFQPGPKRGYDPAAPREKLLKRIDILDVNDTTFDVTFVYSDAGITYQATQDIEAQIVQTLSDVRTNNLVTLRDAIRKQLQWLSFNVTTSSTSTNTSGRPEIINEELAQVRAQIHALSARYTDEHPLLQELRGREETLSRLLETAMASRSKSSAQRQNPVIGGESQEDVRDMTNDLLKKMNYLNIALESNKGHQRDYFAVLESPVYPIVPAGPNKILFAALGLVSGLFGSIFVAAIREYFNRSTLHAETFAHQLGIPLLGKLPVVGWKNPKIAGRN